MLLKLLTWVVSLSLEVQNVVVKKGAGYVLIKFRVAKSPEG